MKQKNEDQKQKQYEMGKITSVTDNKGSNSCEEDCSRGAVTEGSENETKNLLTVTT